jgi:GMP synthase (glutamine-hydrolysing)
MRLHTLTAAHSCDIVKNMKRLLVFQHVAHEILGNLDPLLRSFGFRIRYVNFGRQPDAKPDMSRYSGLIVLGGPMNCDQSDRYPHLATEIEVIREAISEGKPVLGICLGAQLIARALGARVARNPVKEIGWYDLSPTEAGQADPMFAKFAANQKIFQWHGDTFEIPDGAEHLATSPDCRNQAFRYADHVYGLQFHLEVDEPMIHRWLHTPSNARQMEDLGGQAFIEKVENETHAHIQQSIGLGNAVFGEYIRLFHSRPQRITLPSK